jgi:hypothetical protein
MYAMVRRFEGVSDPTELAGRVNGGLVQLISQIPGFVAYYWIDAGRGVMVSTSIFEDQAGLEESDRQVPGWVRENIATFIPNPPQITVGQVVGTS